MLKRVSTIVLVAAAQYVVAAAALFMALERGDWPAATIGALGAGLVALTAIASLLIGRRLGRREAADEAARSADPDPSPVHPKRPPVAEHAQRASAPPAVLARELSFLSHFFVDVVESLPIGFATLDRNFVVRSANRALKKSLGLPPEEPIIGLSIGEIPLGEAIYVGSRALLAGRPFAEIARAIVEDEGSFDLSPLLVPGRGERWRARLRVRLQPWPAPPAATSQYLLWIEEVAGPIEVAAAGPREESPAREPSHPRTPSAAPRAVEHEPPQPALPEEDATARLHAEMSQLREKFLDELLARDALLAALPIGVVVVDAAGGLLGWSDSVGEILGPEISLREGAHALDSWPALRAAPLAAALDALLADGTPFDATLSGLLVPRAGAPRRERVLRGVPVGIPGVPPRRALLLIEERWDPALAAALAAEAAAARSNTRLLAARLPEIRSRLDTISSIARFLATALVGTDIRTLSEIKMIEIQRGRIEEALREAVEPPPGSPKSA